MSNYNSYDNKFEILVLDKELTWTDSYCGYTKPRFKRYKTLSLNELRKCLNHK
ncbi:hypothetical protein KJ652_06045 [Patescibacteria group bacterium]|nr:hypothetical protein [Patescibacteria group bacterium]